MWLKECIRELIAAMFTAAFITFTGMGLIPVEAFIGVAALTIMYYFEEKSKDRLREEIRRLQGK